MPQSIRVSCRSVGSQAPTPLSCTRMKAPVRSHFWTIHTRTRTAEISTPSAQNRASMQHDPLCSSPCPRSPTQSHPFFPLPPPLSIYPPTASHSNVPVSAEERGFSSDNCAECVNARKGHAVPCYVHARDCASPDRETFGWREGCWVAHSTLAESAVEPRSPHSVSQEKGDGVAMHSVELWSD